MPKFAANLTMLFTEAPFLERFALASEAGFEAVEFLFPYAWDAQQISERLRRHQLKLVLHNMPPGDWAAGDRGIACDPRRNDEFRAGVQTALEYASELGVTQLHCMAGKLSGGLEPARARDNFIANLRHAAEQCKPLGINVLLEAINHHDIPGYFLTHTRQALDIIADSGCDNIFLQYDVYHMQRMEGELCNTIRAHVDMIKHIQLADTPGRHEPGTGEINYRKVLAVIDEAGYEGWVGCEYNPLQDTAGSLAWLRALSN